MIGSVSRVARPGVAALLLAALWVTPMPAHASGAWTTYLRAYTYADLIADSTTVWCATLEGGLVQFDRATHTFTTTVREPGGIASNSLTALTFDRSRRLWAGTQGAGLSYLSADRSRWNLLNEFDGLPSDTVNALTPQGDTLWIGTTKGITLWDGQRVLGSLPDGINASPFASNNVTGIVVAGDSLYLATRGGVYRSLESQNLQVWDTLNRGLPTPVVEQFATDGTTIMAFSSDTAWKAPYVLSDTGWVRRPTPAVARRIGADRNTIFVMTSVGMYRWNGAGYAPIPGSPGSGPLPQQWIAPAMAPDGKLYGASRSGMFEQPAGVSLWTLYRPQQPPGNNITNLALEGPRLYMTTYNEGIGRYDGVNWRNWPPGFCQLPACSRDTSFGTATFAFSLLIDRRSAKWFTTWGEPGNPLRPGAVEHMVDDTDPPQFTSVQAWSDGLDPVRHSFGIGSTLDSSGGHWFGLDSPAREDQQFSPIGLDYYDSTGTFVRNLSPSNTGIFGLRTGRIIALTTDALGVIWIGTTGQGVQRLVYDPVLNTAMFETVSPDDKIDVRGIVAVGDTVWAQSTNDVRDYRRSGGLIGAYPVLAGPSDIAGHSLEVAKDGTVWAATVNGVRVYRSDGTVLADYTEANSPLASDEVRAIRSDPVTGVLWIGTAAGLHRFDPRFVPAPPPSVVRLDARVYPNPSRLTALGVDLRLAGNTSDYRGAIYDLTGRLVHSFSGAANGARIWDGRDRDGRRVQPGVYFLHVTAGGRSTLVRIALLH